VGDADIQWDQHDQEVKNQGKKNEIVNRAQQRNGKVQRIQRVQDQDSRRRPQPYRPVRVPEREPQQAQILSSEPPKSN
jgi:hypothetical protein